MNKTFTDNSPGGSPSIYSENPPSSEAGLTGDSGGGQSLHALETKLEYNQNTPLKTTITDKNQNIFKEPIWKEVNIKNRHRSSPEERASKLQQRTKQTSMDYWLNPPVETNNRYSLLDTDGNPALETSSVASDLPIKTEKQIKSPPILVAGVGDINPLHKLLDDIVKEKFILRVINHLEVKIQAKTIEAYDLIVEALRNKNTEFHFYQKKKDKLFKVVLRNMHNLSDLNLLKTKIEGHGHSVINIFNIRYGVTKTPLPMFYVNLKNKQNNKDIYKIEYLLNTKIYIEPPNKKKKKFHNVCVANDMDIPKTSVKSNQDVLNVPAIIKPSTARGKVNHQTSSAFYMTAIILPITRAVKYTKNYRKQNIPHCIKNKSFVTILQLIKQLFLSSQSNSLIMEPHILKL